MEQPNISIADNLKSAREKRGLSYEQLAAMSGVSKSMLRQIEAGKSSPTVTTIWKIANGLRVSFTSLLQQSAVEAKVKSFRSEPPLHEAQEHYRLYPLIPFSPERGFETYYFELDPSTAFDGEPHNGNVTEYIFLNKGTIRISFGSEEHEVSEGEFIQFNADIPHTYECISETQAVGMIQLSYQL